MPIKLNIPSSRGRKSKNSYAEKSSESRPLFSYTSFGGKIKIFFMIIAFISIFCFVLFCLGFGIIKLYQFTITSSYFNTEYIEVRGNDRIPKNVILADAGIELGLNSLDVNIGKVERLILLNPWVETVSVKRVLPRGFNIKIKERIPSFWVHSQGQLNYSDVKGRVIAPVGGSNFVSLPTLNVQDASEDILNNLSTYIEDIKVDVLPLEFASVSNISISRAKGVELYVEDMQINLSIGVDDWEGNLKRLAITLDDVKRRDELGMIKEINASDGNVWVIKK